VTPSEAGPRWQVTVWVRLEGELEAAHVSDVIE
jgi:hypothetical protein